MNILADRLMLLEKYALINKINFDEVPPRVEYSLTENGIELSELLDVMCKFSERIVLRDEAIKC
jgi:DNA-binding HxlR family transcriptional regulator